MDSWEKTKTNLLPKDMTNEWSNIPVLDISVDAGEGMGRTSQYFMCFKCAGACTKEGWQKTSRGLIKKNTQQQPNS